MGSNFKITWSAITLWFIMISNLSCFTSFSQSINTTNDHNNATSLDNYLYKYSSKTLYKKPRVGVLLNISLPSNFSGMDVSIVRLRRNTMWAKGANFSSFDIPPKVITKPYVRRLAIMYENLGNFSSNYFELPGYTFISTILGFSMYNATVLINGTINYPERINISAQGQPIKVRFSGQVNTAHGKYQKHIKCVKFDPISTHVELSELISPNICETNGLGHFALAVPGVNVPQVSQSPPPLSSMGRDSNGAKIAPWKWWLMGVAACLVALMVLVSGTLLCYKTHGSRKLARMERTADKSESLDTRWIGTSKMPSATVTRTQGVIENDLAP